MTSTTGAGRGTPRRGITDLQIRLPFEASPEPADTGGAEEPSASSTGEVVPAVPVGSPDSHEPGRARRRRASGPRPDPGPSPTGGAELVGTPTSSPVPKVHFVRHPRARRYVLRVQPDGSVRVTVPRRGSLREGEAFLQRNRPWVDRQRAKLAASPLRRSLGHGDTVLVAGVPIPLVVEPDGEGFVIGVGEMRRRAKGASDVRALVVSLLRAEAQRQLPGRLLELARQVGLKVGRVTIRDQKGRWGSCAASGNISLNWRLIQMPPDVRDYVLLHELMHLREQNHSRRFWKHVAEVCPWHLQARRWLAREGRALL